MTQDERAFFLITAITILIIFLFLFMAMVKLYVNTIKPFIRTRSYIKMKIATSDGMKYSYWKKELRKLYISHIPIFGRILRRRIR